MMMMVVVVVVVVLMMMMMISVTQAMIQLIGFLVTFVVAGAGGAFAGCLMKLKCFDEPPSRFLYTDEAFWEPKPGKVELARIKLFNNGNKKEEILRQYSSVEI